MFLEKQGNEHTCESAIYTNQNEKLIQQKCTIEYYPKLGPDPDILDAGNYILLGNFPLPWTFISVNRKMKYQLQFQEVPL